MEKLHEVNVAADAKGQSWPYAYSVEQPSAADAKIRIEVDAAKARFQATGRVRPDLNGVAVTAVPWGSGPVFLIDRGYRRGIVSEEVFVSLYGKVPDP